jgi:phosphatidylinositol phospholipase C delta
VNDHEQVDAQEWEINVLCAQNIPKISKKTGGERTNPRVRLTVYDGGSVVPQAYATKVIKRNGFNPIWIDNEESFRFSVNDSSVAIVLFSVWDCDQKTGKEDFLGAAAVPVSCMRQGYRSVALFDANHMRGGDIAYASLFVKATRKSSGEI